MQKKYTQKELDDKSVKMAKKYRDLEKSLGTGAAISLMLYYGIAFGVWSFVFEMNFMWFVLAGITVSLLIIAFLSAPLFTMERTMNHIDDVTFIVGVWTNLAILFGALGLLAWGVRIIVFH